MNSEQQQIRATWLRTKYCMATVICNGIPTVCHSTPIAFRHYTPNEDHTSRERYAPVCKRHTYHDMIPLTTVMEALQFTTLLPADTTINSTLIHLALEHTDSGCTGIVRVNGTWKPCNRPIIALRHWQPNEQHTGETIGGVCKTHAHHDIIPLTILTTIKNMES